MFLGVFQFNGARFHRNVGCKTEGMVDLGYPLRACAGDMTKLREHIRDGIYVVAKGGVVWTGFQVEFEKFAKCSQGSLEDTDFERQGLQKASKHLCMGADSKSCR